MWLRFLVSLAAVGCTTLAGYALVQVLDAIGAWRSERRIRRYRDAIDDEWRDLQISHVCGGEWRRVR